MAHPSRPCSLCPCLALVHLVASKSAICTDITNDRFRNTFISGIFQPTNPDTHVRFDKHGKATIEVQMGRLNILFGGTITATLPIDANRQYQCLE